jgi:hypothetical protein
MTVRKDQSESIHMGNTSIKLIMSYELVRKSQDMNNTCRLRFALPDGCELLGKHRRFPHVFPSNITLSTNLESLWLVLTKSYWPISHPNQKGVVELLIKSICHDQEGCRGLSLQIKNAGRLNPSGRQTKLNYSLQCQHLGDRWQHAGFVDGGTVMVPPVQLANLILESTSDGSYRDTSSDNDECDIKLLSIHWTPVAFYFAKNATNWPPSIPMIAFK